MAGIHVRRDPALSVKTGFLLKVAKVFPLRGDKGVTSSLELSVGDLLWLVGVSMQVRSVRSASMLWLRGPLFSALPSADGGLLPTVKSISSLPCDCQRLFVEHKCSPRLACWAWQKSENRNPR